MYERFTLRGRNILAAANSKAKALGHEFISAGHLLIAMLESRGTGQAIADKLASDSEDLRDHVSRHLEKQHVGVPSAKAVIIAAMEQASSLQHNFIGSEHLLLGILAVPDCEPGQMLCDQGVTLSAARDELNRTCAS